LAESNSTCSIDGCNEAPRARSMCQTHYARYRRNGDITYIRKPFDRSMDTGTHKTCANCLNFKARTEFHRSSRDKDGYRGWCKTCTHASNTAGYLANRENVLENQRRSRQTPERKQYMADYLATYYDANRSDYAARSAVRRSLIRDAFVDEGITIEALRLQHGDTCEFCFEPVAFGADAKGKYNPKRASIEHMIPLSRGGKHSWANTRISCWSCNLTKNDKTPEEFRAYRERIAAA